MVTASAISLVLLYYFQWLLLPVTIIFLLAGVGFLFLASKIFRVGRTFNPFKRKGVAYDYEAISASRATAQRKGRGRKAA